VVVNASVDLTLIVTTIEEIVQILIKELIRMRKRYDAIASDRENQSKDLVSVKSANTSTDKLTSSTDMRIKTVAQSKRPPPPSGRALRHATPEIDKMHGAAT
jgi:hypothetical protein